MEKVKVPQFGREEMIGGMRTVTMESKEAVIIELAEKVNEIVDCMNRLKSYTGNGIVPDNLTPITNEDNLK